MSKDITLRSNDTNNSLARRGNVSVGESSSSSGLKFSGKAEMYTDLPTTFRKGASKSNALVLAKEAKERQNSTSVVLASKLDIKNPVNLPPKVAETSIASGVRKLSKSFKNGDRIVQRKLGWFATPTYIYVTTVERELSWREDGKLSPSSEWLIENRRKWKPTQGVAEKRVGKVKEREDVYANESYSSNYVEEAEAIPDAFVNGAEAMSYLPKTVRGDIVTQVPRPTYFDGRLLGIVNNVTGEVDKLEVALLRMDDNVALVINAVSPISSDEWEVTQARYLLTTPEVESA